MSEFYFCIFCDTIVLALDLLREHLTQHLSDESDGGDSLSDADRQFVDNFVNYEKQLSLSMTLMPKELPKNNVKILLMGCPTCDSLIRCYDLIANRDNKQICICGQQSEDNPKFQCIQCRHYNHLKCGFKSGHEKCIDCMSKNFKISYLKCLPFETQRDHCYQHMDYYPFVCQIRSANGQQICGQKIITMSSCEKHLLFDHNYHLNGNKDICDILSLHFDYNPIEKIDTLINNRLNSKINVDISGIVINQTNNVSTAERNDFMSNIGLVNGNQTNPYSMATESDDEFNNSFNYTSQELAKSYSKTKTSSNYHRNKRLDKSLDFIPLPKSAPKRRGRPPKNRSLPTPETISIQSIENLETDEISDTEEAIDLTHRRQYINWFTQTNATKFPYFPQKDDEVYYLPYGHELYKEEVMRRGLYNQSNRNYTMRFFNYDKILAKVAKIDFLFKERRKSQTVIRCIYITLRPRDDKYGTIIHVKYHDMDGVLDFIVLKEHYELSVQKLWNIGEEFRSIIDDKYWFGVVIGYNDSEYCQNTLFRKYQIQWHSNGAVDFLSPWDLETVDPTKVMDRHSFMPITDVERRSFFSRISDEWPECNEDKELRRLAKGLKVIYKMDKTTEFPILQDLTDSRYREKILYPVDMKTFISRIENHFYRRHSAIKYDIKFMESNIRKLIKSLKRDPEYRFEELIAKRLKYHTKFVTALSLLFIDTHDCRNPYDLYPHIDDYLETHDLKCYSAKRVHLNSRKKHPNGLPVPHKRLPKRPQSFGDSAKTLKIFKALSNTDSLSRRESEPNPVKTSKHKKMSKTKAETVSKCYAKAVSVPLSSNYEELIVPQSSQGDDIEKFYSSDNTNSYNTFEPNYSSDVSRSENEYQLQCFESLSNCTDDTDVDPDFQTTNYHKNKF